MCAFVRVRVVYSAVVGDRRNDTTTRTTTSPSVQPDLMQSIYNERLFFFSLSRPDHKITHLSIKMAPILFLHEPLSLSNSPGSSTVHWNESIIQSNNRSVASHHTHMHLPLPVEISPFALLRLFIFFTDLWKCHEYKIRCISNEKEGGRKKRRLFNIKTRWKEITRGLQCI